MAIAWLEVFTSFANSFDVSSVIPMFIGLKSIGIPIWVFPFHLEVPSLTLWRLPLVGIFPICSSSIAFLFPTKTSLTLLSHISYSWLPPFSRFSWQGSWISRLLSFSVHVHRFFFFLTRFFFFLFSNFRTFPTNWSLSVHSLRGFFGWSKVKNTFVEHPAVHSDSLENSDSKNTKSGEKIPG